MKDSDSVWGGVARLAWVGLRSFLGTLLLLTLAGLVLGGCAFYLLRDHPLYGGIAAAVAVVEAVAAGVVLGVKRGLILALVHGLRTFGLGRSAVRQVFDRLLGTAPRPGEGEGWVVRGLERLPLAEAEARLTEAVRNVLRTPPGGHGDTGWFRRRVHARLLGSVQKYTLARFREEGAGVKGIDLRKVQGELEGRIDEWLVARLRRGLNLWTGLVILALPAVVFAETYAVLALLHAK